MNVTINHCNNKTRDLVADRNHIDIHIILQCYRCLKPSLPVHHCFKITDAISLAIRFYYLISIKKHIFKSLFPKTEKDPSLKSANDKCQYPNLEVLWKDTRKNIRKLLESPGVS